MSAAEPRLLRHGRQSTALSGETGEFFIFIVWKIMMPNQGNMRNRGVSSRLMAVNCASGEDALSEVESVVDELHPPVRNDRLYVVSEPASSASPASPAPDQRVGEDNPGRADIRNGVVDADIRVAKWAWAILAIAHCWLIYFMVHNLG